MSPADDFARTAIHDRSVQPHLEAAVSAAGEAARLADAEVMTLSPFGLRPCTMIGSVLIGLATPMSRSDIAVFVRAAQLKRDEMLTEPFIPNAIDLFIA